MLSENKPASIVWWSYSLGHSGQWTPENAALRSYSFKWGTTGLGVPLCNSIIGHFMIYQDRRETKSLQLFTQKIQNGFL